MDHNYAIENHSAERYLLHELNEEERDAYEEHFFSCSACADEVKIASEFLESARHVVQDEVTAQLYDHAGRRSIWGSWLNFRSMLHPMPAMACALLVVVSSLGVYQNAVVIPGLRKPPLPQLGIALPALHSTKSVVKVIPFSKNKSFTIPFEIPSLDVASYDVSVLTQANVKRFSFQNISSNEAQNTLEIIVPAGTLESGSYYLLIEGSGGKGEVDRIPFELKSQD